MASHKRHAQYQDCVFGGEALADRPKQMYQDYDNQEHQDQIEQHASDKAIISIPPKYIRARFSVRRGLEVGPGPGYFTRLIADKGPWPWAPIFPHGLQNGGLPASRGSWNRDDVEYVKSLAAARSLSRDIGCSPCV